MDKTVSNYELGRRIRSAGAGGQGQEIFSQRALAVEQSPVNFYEYFHSHNRSLRGQSDGRIDGWSIGFLEEELHKGVKRRVRGPSYSTPPSGHVSVRNVRWSQK